MYTSSDILYIVIAFCVLWLTIFISWSLYYVAMLLRGVYRTFEDFRDRVAAIDRFVKLIGDKAEHASSSLQLLVDGVGRVATFLMARSEPFSRRTTTKKGKKNTSA
ncbi:MAG: hypothetical protein WC817_03590 [Patescibacteria group bacterium]|jgi:uncharacterized membrane protein